MACVVYRVSCILSEYPMYASVYDCLYELWTSCVYVPSSNGVIVGANRENVVLRLAQTRYDKDKLGHDVRDLLAASNTFQNVLPRAG